MSAHPRERLHAIVDKRMTKLRLWATGYAREQSTRGADGAPAPWETKRWDERTVADVMCGNVLTIHEAGVRANKLANRPAGQLAVVVVPARIEDPREWEAKAKALEAQGRKVIDTTLGPSAIEAKKP